MAEARHRHDLDWLRVGAFSLLILYHIGMFYVSWDWHVKSPHAPVSWMETPMALTNVWRLPLLFFISGVALAYAMDRYGARNLLGRRIVVLLVPLLFGMYVVCAPQAWFELTEKHGWDGSVRDFYRGYVDWPWASPEGWPIITPTWNHLWYVLYVLVYSVVLILAGWAFGDRLRGGLARVAALPGLLLIVPLVQIGLAALMNDSIGRAQTLWGDWYNLATSFLVMLLGFAVATVPDFWARLRAGRLTALGAALLLSVLVVVARQSLPPTDVGLSAQFVLRILQGWSVIWALLGWGQVLLDRDGPVLRYCSAAVFTWYVLHQTIIIAVGVPLGRLGWPLWAEAGALTLATILLCFAGYHLVARHMGRFGLLLGARNRPAFARLRGDGRGLR